MADFMLLGLFDNVDTTADVLDEIRALGVNDNQVTVMSNVPYPARFFGRKPARLWFLPFALGGALTGILVAAFIALITPQLYPIHVGGQGLTPVPPTAIMFFEFTALFTMLGSFVGFLLQNRFPVLTRQMYDERITDGYIGVEVRATSSLVDDIVKIFESHHAHVVHREDAAAYPANSRRHLLFWGGVGTAGLAALAIPLLLTYDIVKLPWINTMSDTVVVGHQEGPRRAAPPDSVPVQGPVLIAGEPATAPLPATETSLERGKTLFNIYCAVCHGPLATGDGPLGRDSYLPETRDLTDSYVQGLPDNAFFLVITNGKNRMPGLAEQLSPGDTWDIINYVRSLSSQSSSAGQ